MAARKTKRRTVQIKRGNKLTSPSWEGWEEWSGEHFHRFKESTRSFYYSNYKSEDIIPAVYKFMEADKKYSADDIKAVKKCPSYVLGTTVPIVCKMLQDGMPDYNKKEAEYWESLAGTSGTMKPSTEFVYRHINDAVERGKKIEDEAKQEEQKQLGEGKVKYVMSIQERIREATSSMCEFIEAALDDFVEGKITDFKDVKPASQLRQLQCKQPHARLIQSHYEPMVQEYNELLNPPTKFKTEQDQDYHQQLKDGYSHYSKKQIKQLYEFMVSIIGACDAIIAESKANRKPRKISKKSPEQLVKKLKYKLSDDKYSVASIEAHKLVGSNCLVVFNGKTRKLGIYYTSIEDPTGAGREGSGLDVKGTTLVRFDEEKSVACTLRKPLEQLQEVKTLNTRRKFENWFEKLTTTPIKMNGRINAETVLLAVY